MARRLLTIILVLVTAAQGAVNVNGSATGCLVYGSPSTTINMNIPLTQAYWQRVTNTTNDGYGIFSPSAFAMLLGGSAGAGYCAVAEMVYNRPSGFNLCSDHSGGSAIVPSINTWCYDATVANAAGTSVHFYQLCVGGSVTTSDASHTITNGFSVQGPIIGASNTSCAAPLQGAIAGAYILNGTSRAPTDKELKALAYFGPPFAAPFQATASWSLSFSNAPGANIPDSGSAGSTHPVKLVASGTAGTYNHPPITGIPWFQ